MGRIFSLLVELLVETALLVTVKLVVAIWR